MGSYHTIPFLLSSVQFILAYSPESEHCHLEVYSMVSVLFLVFPSEFLSESPSFVVQTSLALMTSEYCCLEKFCSEQYK
jgi:hypothetical protein